MSSESPIWQVQPTVDLPDQFLQTVQRYARGLPGHYAAQLLWQRGMQDPDQLPGYLDPNLYQPASPFAFGQEMERAVTRLQQARQQKEKVAIWGDFDADGVTATAVLWEGLGQFLFQGQQLVYTIPDRLTESHGLSIRGIEALANQGCSLIVTCDTGSTNLTEIDYAQTLGLDVIVTDHHTLPEDRPPVTAIINPRYLAKEHPLFHLSGVAVAYKLVEALYQALPEVPQKPLEELLDLVAIGLIADLVQLRGDCRHLAQWGIEQLKAQRSTRSRPGVARLLELCKRTGDRPTDISFGIGPRINAVSRIQGDARFCVELLTSEDIDRCRQLAQETEWANTRRKALQRDIVSQVKARVDQLDLSTTQVIVLWEPEWPVGILGLAAGQIAQEYGRPTILLSTEAGAATADPNPSGLARGSARSVNQVDLYQLVKNQEHLLHRFGGHPFAAGLSLPVENIPLFMEAVNQELRQALIQTSPTIYADLVVTVAELGQSLDRELRLLEPHGMGNPIPRLLIQNCWFERVWHKNLEDPRGGKLRYIRTHFQLWDDTVREGIKGIWWGHYRDEVPQGRCDAIVELDRNTKEDSYEVRLISVRLHQTDLQLGGEAEAGESQTNWILDWRQSSSGRGTLPEASVLPVSQCPTSWDEFHQQSQQARTSSQTLAIAYSSPQPINPEQIWQHLVGIAKYLSRTGKPVTRQQILEKLGISEASLELGLQALVSIGITVETPTRHQIIMQQGPPQTLKAQANPKALHSLIAALQEEQFHRQYFQQVPVQILEAAAQQ